MATSGDIVRQGYLYIKRPPFGSRLRRLRTWQRYFVLLRDEFEEGKITLEFYNHERAAVSTETETKGRGTTKVIELTGIAHVGRVSKAASQHAHCFTIVPDEEQPPLILACDDNMRMLEWISAVKLLSSKLVKPPEPVPRREPPSGEDRTERQSSSDLQQQSSPLTSEGVMIRPKPDGASASRSPGKRRSYKVYVMPTELASTIKLTGVFRIRVTRRSVEVYSLYGGAPKLNLPLSCIKGYKVYPSAVEVDKILVLETARHSPAGQGIFQFRTAHCDNICDAIRMHTTEGEDGLVPIDVPEQDDGDEDDAPRSPTITLRNIDGLSSCSQRDSMENVETKEYAGKCFEDIACASFSAFGDGKASDGAEMKKVAESSSDENDGTQDEEEAGYLTLLDTSTQDDASGKQRIVPIINVNPAASEGSKPSSPVNTDLERQPEGEASTTLIVPKKENCSPDPKKTEGDRQSHGGAAGDTKVLHDTEANEQDATKQPQIEDSAVPSVPPSVDGESKNDDVKDEGCSEDNRRSGGDGARRDEEENDEAESTSESAGDGTAQSVSPSDTPSAIAGTHTAVVNIVPETSTSAAGSQESSSQQVRESELDKDEKDVLCLPDATEESSSDELDTTELRGADDVVSHGPTRASEEKDETLLQEDKGSISNTQTPDTGTKKTQAEPKASDSENEAKEEPTEDTLTPKATVDLYPPAKSPIKLGPTTSLGAEKNAEDETTICRATSLPPKFPEVSDCDVSPGPKTARHQRDIIEDYEDIHPHGPLQRGIPLTDFVSPDAVVRPVVSNPPSPMSTDKADDHKATDDKTVAPGKRSGVAEPPPLPPRTYKMRPGYSPF
ncbi:Hypp7807 [Branchiostoma lanceolatum]|uniref:Hypp7807 protein n=1 Tax=Branchiostoma lanceolatum TaxID=7740 RepID=A0A8J9Z3J7_BRALA|nr:Hypp7807 [Branchiostoma lanceolatum]